MRKVVCPRLPFHFNPGKIDMPVCQCLLLRGEGGGSRDGVRRRRGSVKDSIDPVDDGLFAGLLGRGVVGEDSDSWKWRGEVERQSLVWQGNTPSEPSSLVGFGWFFCSNCLV
jgi:hypothetical protein